MNNGNEIIRGIFQVGIDMAEVDAGLTKIVQKYKGAATATDEQIKKIQELTDKEAKLIQARAKTNNPTTIVQYNKAIEQTVQELKKLNEQTGNLAKNETEADTRAKRLQESIRMAFQATSINAIIRKLQDVKKEFSSVSAGAKAFLKSMIQDVPKATNEFIAMRKALKEAKGELAAAFASGDQKRIEEAAAKVGELKDKMDELTESSRIFAGSDKFEQIGTAMGDIVGKVARLDFSGAASQSKILLSVSKSLTFSEALKGAKDLGITLANIGKALLVNPLFLMAAAIGFIIAKFDALKTSGGFIGKVFTGISKAIEVAGTAIKDFLGFLGLIDPLKKSLEEIIDINERLIKSSEAYYDRQIKLAEARRTASLKLENERANETLKILLRENRAIQKAYEDREIDLKEFQEKSVELAIRASNILTDKEVKNIETVKKAEDGLRELRRKLREEKEKGQAFDISFKLAPNSEQQVKAALALQIKQLKAAATEEARQAKIDFKDYDGGVKARGLIWARFQIAKVNAEAAANKLIIDKRKELAQQALELERKKNEIIVQEASGSEALKTASLLDIERRYYEDLIALYIQDIEARQKAGLSTVDQEKALAELRLEARKAEFDGNKEVNKQLTDEAIAQLQLAEDHSQAQLRLQNRTESRKLFDQLKYEKQRLEILKAAGNDYLMEAKRQEDAVAELQKAARKQLITEIADYYSQLSTAALEAYGKIIQADVDRTDKQISLQQKRVDEAKDIADKGNARMLELEKKRLDDLNKQKEKYVREQQALSTLELISQTAVMVAKAGAEGGAAAAVTIGAALLALVAGLISARQTASQAAFYSGGEFEGFTGEGNPHDESTAGGKKPYIYHKREFIFNHGTTDKYRDIFHRIHRGEINLRAWEQKVKMFDSMMAAKDFNIHNPYILQGLGGMNGMRLENVEKLLSQLIRVTESKEPTSFHMDKEGLFFGLNSYANRRQKIDKLAR